MVFNQKRGRGKLMFDKKLKEEVRNLYNQILGYQKEIKFMVDERSKRRDVIKLLRQEILAKKDELREKGYNMEELQKTIRKLEYWLPSLLDIQSEMKIKTIHNGFIIKISPSRFSSPQFPEMVYRQYSNDRDRIEIVLGSNPVLNDIFKRQLALMFACRDEISYYEGEVTVYGGIKTVTKIIGVYSEALKKYDKLVTILDPKLPSDTSQKV